MPGRSYVSTTQSREKYTGHELDAETGLLYAGARYLDPTIGRWMSVDPLADHPAQVDKSPYAYAWNNPVNLMDEMGLCPDCRDEEYVELADHVYKAKKGDMTVNGWEVEEVISEESGFQGAVYKKTRNGTTDYIFATAGTQDAVDGIEDVRQLVGKSAQYRESVIKARELSSQYEGISFTGHSLGGGLASANALAVEGKAVTFNAAALSGATKQGLGLNSRRGDIHAYIVEGEIVDHAQSNILGVRAEGRKTILPSPTRYVPQIPLTLIDDSARLGQRVRNHTMNVVKRQFDIAQQHLRFH